MLRALLAVVRVVVFTTLFYLMVTPVAVAMRAFGRNRLRRTKSSDGFWARRS